MKIVADLSAEVPDTNAFHFKLEELSEESGRTLFYGYNSAISTKSSEEEQVFFNNWSPCEFAQTKPDALSFDKTFDYVYTICPFTARWLNEVNENNRYRYIFYPFNKSITPETQEKKCDVIYHGGIHGVEHEDCLKTISKFNYRYVTMRHHINQRTIEHLHFGTDFDLPFAEKIKLVAQSKASVCFNFVNNEPKHTQNIKSYPLWEKNEAFSEVDKWNVMPQFKTRFHEAAISRTLNLCMKDSWNVVEDYYEPGKEFLYFEDMEELEEILDDVKHNWEDYKDIVEAAYLRAQDYTTENFVAIIKAGNQFWSGRDA